MSDPIDRRWADVHWYTADQAGKVYDAAHKQLAVLMDIRDALKSVTRLLLGIQQELQELQKVQTKQKPCYPPLPEFYTEVFGTLVDDLELSIRTSRCLENEGIRTVGELIKRSRSELLRTPNFGRKSLRELEEVLAQLGLRLKDYNQQ